VTDFLIRRSARLTAIGSLVLLAVAGPAGCATRSTSVASRSVAPGQAASALPDPTPDPGHPALGPAQATIGRPYPFDLYVHCNGEFTSFSGAVWRTDVPPGDVGSSSDPSGVTHYTGYLAGWMTMTGPGDAMFSSGSRVIPFKRVTADPPPCL
jgi:hypothetical protein